MGQTQDFRALIHPLLAGYDPLARPASSGSKDTAMIAGASVGAALVVVLIGVIVAAVLFCRRGRRTVKGKRVPGSPEMQVCVCVCMCVSLVTCDFVKVFYADYARGEVRVDIEGQRLLLHMSYELEFMKRCLVSETCVSGMKKNLAGRRIHPKGCVFITPGGDKRVPREAPSARPGATSKNDRRL